MDVVTDSADTLETRTDVIGVGNPVLSLITTEDGIPTSTEVTVLTTVLGDVPLMTLEEVPVPMAHHGLSGHPTFAGTSHEVTRYTSITPAPPRIVQPVLLSDARIAIMDTNGGVKPTIVVHAGPTQLTTLAQARRNDSIVSMTIQQQSGHLNAESIVINQETDPVRLMEHVKPETNTLEVLQTPDLGEIADVNVLEHRGTLLSESTSSSNYNVLQQISTAAPEKSGQSDRNVHDFDVTSLDVTPRVFPPTQLTQLDNNDSTSTNKLQLAAPLSAEGNDPIISEDPPPPVPANIPEEVVCLVCYQTFLNPKRSKQISEKEREICKVEGDNATQTSVSVESKGSEDKSEKSECDRCYGRTLGKFFEISRVSMSIVTRRSYKEYEVPICQNCMNHLNEAEKLLDNLKRLERELYFTRQRIKDEIIKSYEFFKDNKELTESRRNAPDLVEILEIVDRIRDDVINDGRPPKLPRSVVESKRKAKTKNAMSVSEQSQPELEVGNMDPPGNPLKGSESTVTSFHSPNMATDLGAGTSQTSVGGNSSNNIEVLQTLMVKAEKESDKDRAITRTSFGRVVKRPFHMISEATEDEVSGLSDSSEDNYEEIEVKPEILTEGELGIDPDDDIDEEDPAWSPGRGVFINEKIGGDPLSSEDTDDLTDEGSDLEGVPKGKVKTKTKAKKRKVRKPRQPKTRVVKKLKSKNKTARKKKIKKSSAAQENENYEVKVIQLDGTELMTINTGCSGNIGLEPDITQKVLDSQAIIMVKNQLFGKRVACSQCNKSFTDPARRDLHVKRKHEGVTKPFECEICQKRFGRQDHLRNHKKRHTRPPIDKASKTKQFTSEKNQECQYCGQRFRNKSELSVHLRLHTGERPFKCEHCQDAFVSALKKEFHIEQVHPEVPPLRCEFCPKGFFRQHRLRIHAVGHTGEKTNICEVCGKCFSQAAMLRYHQTTHEELNLRQFKCQECGRVFANPQNLKSHMESQHQKMYRHRCDTCGRGYTQMSHLRRHLRTHSGEQPFECAYCPRKFTSGAALKIHVRIHTGERPYWCSQCEKGFRSKTKLGRHMKTLIHSGDNKGFKKETVKTEIETVDVNTTENTSWTEIVGIITGI